MYGNTIKDNHGKKIDLDIRNQIEEEGKWDTLTRREKFQIPQQERITEILSSKHVFCNELGEETKIITSDDEFSHISFPTIGFCENIKKQDPGPKYPQITDLCQEDRQKIANLVKEISRCRQGQIEKNVQLKNISNDISKLKIYIGKLEKENCLLRSSVKHNDENMKLLSKSFIERESNFKKQNTELQNNVKELNDEKRLLQHKLDDTQKQVERLSDAIYNVSMENKLLNKKYDHAKEKFKNTAERLTNIESEYQELNCKKMESKTSQTLLPSLQSNSSQNKNDKRKEYKRFYRGRQCKYEQDERDSTDEDSLISELFFIPKQKNLSNTSYFSDEEY